MFYAYKKYFKQVEKRNRLCLKPAFNAINTCQMSSKITM